MIDADQIKTIKLEMEAEKPSGSGHYHAGLNLPAKEYEILDAKQRLRAAGSAAKIEITVAECKMLPVLEDLRIQPASVDELNVLAERLTLLTDAERNILNAVVAGELEKSAVSVAEVIGIIDELDSIPVAYNVPNLEELGRFVIENEMNDDVTAVPESSRYLLDLEKIGRFQQECDHGLFVGGTYVAAGLYSMSENSKPEIQTKREPAEQFVFRVKVGEYPTGGTFETEEDAEWISLPISAEEAKEAALSAEHPENILKALYISKNLTKYELSPADDYGDFFKEYISHNIGSGFDSTWLDTLLTQDAGEKLASRLGASLTEYGVISARGHSLYELVTHENKEDEYMHEEMTANEFLSLEKGDMQISGMEL